MENQLYCNDKPNNPIGIKIHRFGYHCDDGCCYNYGTTITINDVELKGLEENLSQILYKIFDHLGIQVNITETEDFD